MAKKNSTKNSHPPSQASCEIIELAIDEVELLTRTFKLISDVCDNASSARVSLDDELPKDRLN